MAARQTLTKTKGPSTATFVVEAGYLKYRAELYVDDELVDSKSGLLGRTIEHAFSKAQGGVGSYPTSVMLRGGEFSAYATFGLNAIDKASIQ